MGLPDDCEELMTLRSFRDHYLIGQPGGREQIRLYYEVAPIIVRNIRRQHDREAILQRIYAVTADCVRAIKARGFEEARQRYICMTMELVDRFCPEYASVHLLR